ncbi:hypothetical protein DSUL_60298 [Desulfovibrionales bacterium]
MRHRYSSFFNKLAAKYYDKQHLHAHYALIILSLAVPILCGRCG